MGEVRGAKKIGRLLECSARYLSEPEEDKVGVAEITLPDGSRVSTDAAEADQLLSDELGLSVTLWPLQPADRLDHYRRAEPLGERTRRSVFALEPGEPLPADFELPP